MQTKIVLLSDDMASFHADLPLGPTCEVSVKTLLLKPPAHRLESDRIFTAEHLSQRPIISV